VSAERLQKILATAGVASRRAAERLIVDGRVSVNGATVAVLGAKADPATDDIRVDGRRVGPALERRYLLLNKPVGVVSTRSDPQGRPTVVEMVPAAGGYVFPVGRLDYDSEGLLILTNDGDLAARLTHPRYGVEKVYHAVVTGRPGDRAISRLERGIVLDGRRTAPARVRILKRSEARGEQALLEIVIHEGRTRQVRRMCESVGHPVVRLARVRIGSVTDPGLRPGQWRPLTPREVEALRRSASQPASPPRTARPPTSRRPARRRSPRRG
jgi:pseudouridine synthase